MAKKATNSNGRTRLEEAIALLIQNEAAFVARQAETDKRMAEADIRWSEARRDSDERQAAAKRESDERFARIEAQMATIIQVLNEHSRILERLPDAIREKIGFKAPA